MNTFLAVLNLLGLPEDAGHPEAIERLSSLKAETAELISATGAYTVSGAIEKLAALKSDAETYEIVTAQLSAIDAQKTRVELLSLFEQGKRDRKFTPALEEWALGQSVESLTELLRVAEPIELLTHVPYAEPPRGTSCCPPEIATLLEKSFSEMTTPEKHALYEFDVNVFESKKAEGK